MNTKKLKDSAEHHKAKVLKVAKSLIGTSKSISELDLESYGLPLDWKLLNEPQETLKEFDVIAIECAGCGWWFGSENITTENGEQFCENCNNDEIEAEREEEEYEKWVKEEDQ